MPDIMVNGDSVRRLRQYAREYFNYSEHWSEVFAAIYLDRARIFPLVDNGPAKKLQWLAGQIIH